MPTAADLSFFNRTVDVSPSGLLRERLDARSIVRMWGQRNTVHVYDVNDWPFCGVGSPPLTDDYCPLTGKLTAD